MMTLVNGYANMETVLQKNVTHVIIDAFKRNACCHHFVTLPNASENL
jgi:hypothetical protein